MKRHFTLTDTGWRCAACRNEFNSFDLIARHYDTKGKCKHPTAIGCVTAPDVNNWHWREVQR